MCCWIVCLVSSLQLWSKEQHWDLGDSGWTRMGS